MSAPEADRRPDTTALAILAGLIVLALVLRFWRLGEWNLQATEIFTLRDSVRPQFRNPRPLGYLLNYYVVRPFMPLDEFGLRLLPAMFGVLAVPSFYYVSRRLVSNRAALFGALLLAISPLLISYSQLARYWSLVFCLSTIYPYALYLGVRDRNNRALTLGLVTLVLGILAHPVSALAVVGPGLLLAANLRGERLKSLWNQKAVRWAVLVAVLLAAAAVVRLLPILQRWITEHDENPGSGQFLTPPTGAPGVKQIVYILAFIDNLSLPVAACSVVGLYLLWKVKDRTLAKYLISVAAVPIVFLTLISMRTPVSTYYLLPTVPVFLIGAGVFFDKLYEVDWGVRPQWLFPVTVLGVVIAASLPTLASDYRNGRRYDFRAAGRWLQKEAQPGDVAYSDQPLVLKHYLEGMDVERLRYNVQPLEASLRDVHRGSETGAVWIVAPGLSHALRTNLKQGGLITWIYGNCQLRNTVGQGRVDFRQQYLQIYRCPPTTPG